MPLHGADYAVLPQLRPNTEVLALVFWLNYTLLTPDPPEVPWGPEFSDMGTYI